MAWTCLVAAGEEIAHLREDDVAGQLHFVAADVGAGAALGGGQLIDGVERFGERSAGWGHGRVERLKTLAKRVDSVLRALAPERQALTGRDVGVQRRAKVEE